MLGTNSDYLEGFQGMTRENIPRIDFHLHTSWTDGENTVREMHDQALREGLEMVLFSEHARKTSGDWYGRFAEEVRALPLGGCRALVGVETKIENFEGDLDCPDSILEQCDLVMASVHRFPDKNGGVRHFSDVPPQEALELEFQLAKAILQNPKVNIIGHPFGMCYRRYRVLPSEKIIRALIAKAAGQGVAFEINPHYHPDPWRLVECCQELGARFSLGSNAHSVEEVGKVIRVLEGKELAWIGSESS